MATSISQSRTLELLAAFKAKRAAEKEAANATQKPTIQTEIAAAVAEVSAETLALQNPQLPAIQLADGQSNSPTGATDKFGNSITYNEKQTEFINLASTGESCILIGAAGTGKTTSQKGAILAMIQAGLLPIMQGIEHKHLQNGTPGIAICAYTRRATNNIRRNLSSELQGNCLTIHKLLEYEPVYYEEADEKGNLRKTMRFEPTRNAENPLPSSLKCVVIEESSMVSVELFQQLEAALPHEPQYIFLGDIQQLPPVFGSAILGFKMLELPTVELTEVYRQALNSPIISLAHRILSGKPIPLAEYPDWKRDTPDGKLTLFPWKKQISADSATLTLAKFFLAALDRGEYDPNLHGILIPFNKSCGTIELNNHIAYALAQKEDRPVWEVIHGWKRSYYSIGDKCLYDKEDCIVTNIYRNPDYAGVAARDESRSMDYWGHRRSSGDSVESGDDSELGEDDIDQLLASVAADSGEGEEKTRTASHTIVLQMLDSEREIRIKTAGELGNLNLGYAITVHKSQGSEFEKVFFCLHKSHATMIQRELMYTAVTRAKRELFVICEPDSFTKGIINQRIRGNTLREKAEYFKGKLESGDLQS